MHATVRTLLRLTIAVTACLAVTSGATAAVAAEPIQPGQHFVGIVNGGAPTTTPVAVVYTVCGGPVWPGRTGPVLGGQSLAVAHVKQGGGFTSIFSQVNAWFEQDSSPLGPQQVRFTTYGTRLPIPATVRVPCDGKGQVEFSSCPRLAPCAAGWVPVLVPVRFVNVAL